MPLGAHPFEVGCRARRDHVQVLRSVLVGRGQKRDPSKRRGGTPPAANERSRCPVAVGPGIPCSHTVLEGGHVGGRDGSTATRRRVVVAARAPWSAALALVVAAGGTPTAGATPRAAPSGTTPVNEKEEREATASLLASIPEAYRAGCQIYDTVSNDSTLAPFAGHVVASVRCNPESGADVAFYTQFDDAATMDGAFNAYNPQPSAGTGCPGSGTWDQDDAAGGAVVLLPLGVLRGRAQGCGHGLDAHRERDPRDRVPPRRRPRRPRRMVGVGGRRSARRAVDPRGPGGADHHAVDPQLVGIAADGGAGVAARLVPDRPPHRRRLGRRARTRHGTGWSQRCTAGRRGSRP